MEFTTQDNFWFVICKMSWNGFQLFSLTSKNEKKHAEIEKERKLTMQILLDHSDFFWVSGQNWYNAANHNPQEEAIILTGM